MASNMCEVDDIGDKKGKTQGKTKAKPKRVSELDKYATRQGQLFKASAAGLHKKFPEDHFVELYFFEMPNRKVVLV